MDNRIVAEAIVAWINSVNLKEELKEKNYNMLYEKFKGYEVKGFEITTTGFVLLKGDDDVINVNVDLNLNNDLKDDKN